MSELKSPVLAVKDTKGTFANRAIAFNNTTANVAAIITIISVPFCPLPYVQFTYKSYGFNLQNISVYCYHPGSGHHHIYCIYHTN